METEANPGRAEVLELAGGKNAEILCLSFSMSCTSERQFELEKRRAAMV